ncbi:MAG: putative CRISPR-associated protein [Pseudomonadota bacterium]
MRRVVISTVGTSLLTNQINRANPDEKNWYVQLRDSANLHSKADTPLAVQEIIEELRERARDKLVQSKTAVIRAISAELNGLYGLYDNQLAQSKQDIHFLISTATYQCKTTAEVIRDFLREQGLLSVEIQTPSGLSTASTEDFSSGVDDLIVWLRENIPAYKARGFKVYFNLVGGFKSLQGYLNTIGMFYADEILYIFEGKNAELISIPRLPITLDCEAIMPHRVTFALMNAGLDMLVNEDIPESLVLRVDELMTLSTWGNLVWGECKKSLLSQELLAFPRLSFDDSFRQDYKKIVRSVDKINLQETLAKVSCLLEQHEGDAGALKKDGGLKYENFINRKKTIGHFRVDRGLRVTCVAKKGVLHLRRYGQHEVIDNP